MAHFLRAASSRFGRPVPDWSAADLAAWQAQGRPGNVRELKNAAERFCLGIAPRPTATEALQLPRKTLYDKLARLGIHPVAFRPRA